MVLNETNTGRVMRPSPDGVEPLFREELKVLSREEAEKLSNPNKLDPASADRGERQFRIHCYACHGDISKKGASWSLGEAGQKFTIKKPPHIAEDQRIIKSSDGYLYGVIHFGYGLMPSIGYKLSPSEEWDIVNYIRKAQGIENKTGR